MLPLSSVGISWHMDSLAHVLCLCVWWHGKTESICHDIKAYTVPVWWKSGWKTRKFGRREFALNIHGRKFHFLRCCYRFQCVKLSFILSYFLISTCHCLLLVIIISLKIIWFLFFNKWFLWIFRCKYKMRGN